MLDLFALDFVRSALIVSVMMGLLLSYLGTHVVGRGIVFVDLALGQISMLGVAVATYLELNPTTVSVIFTLFGAFLLSFIKVTDKRLKQEAKDRGLWNLCVRNPAFGPGLAFVDYAPLAELLGRLAGRGVRLGLVTGKGPETTRHRSRTRIPDRGWSVVSRMGALRAEDR